MGERRRVMLSHTFFQEKFSSLAPPLSVFDGVSMREWCEVRGEGNLKRETVMCSNFYLLIIDFSPRHQFSFTPQY